jgi:hypothetical protein
MFNASHEQSTRHTSRLLGNNPGKTMNNPSHRDDRLLTEFNGEGVAQCYQGGSHRTFLVEYNRESVIKCYQGGIANGMKEPIVIVLDLTDGLAAAILAASLPGGMPAVEEMARSFKQEHGDKFVPTAFVASERYNAMKMLQRGQQFMHKADSSNPAKSKVVEQLQYPPPAGYFYAFSIAGGKQLINVELPKNKAEVLKNLPPVLAPGTTFITYGQHRFQGQVKK